MNIPYRNSFDKGVAQIRPTWRRGEVLPEQIAVTINFLEDSLKAPENIFLYFPTSSVDEHTLAKRRTLSYVMNEMWLGICRERGSVCDVMFIKIKHENQRYFKQYCNKLFYDDVCLEPHYSSLQRILLSSCFRQKYPVTWKRVCALLPEAAVFPRLILNG